MGAEKVKSKCFVGVYWRESDNPQRTHNGRHDRIEMTERYAHLIPGQKKDKLKLIASRLEGAAA